MARSSVRLPRGEDSSGLTSQSAAGLLGTAHSILHELNPTNPEHHEQIKTLLEDCELQMIFVSPRKQTNRPPLPT